MKARQYKIDWVALSNGFYLVKIGPVVTEILALEERYGRVGSGRVGSGRAGPGRAGPGRAGSQV